MGCSEAVGLAMDGPAPSLLCSHLTLSFGLKSRCVMPGHSIGVESSGKVSSLDVLTITAFPAAWSKLGACREPPPSEREAKGPKRVAVPLAATVR